MVSMQLTAAEAKEYSVGGSNEDLPKYPYGLCLYLDDDSLKKLGMTSTPEVGAAMKLTAKVMVVGVGMDQQQDGDKEQRVSIQITDMELAAAVSGPSTASVLYGATPVLGALGSALHVAAKT